MISQHELIDLFEYRDGDLYWRKPPNQRIPVGSRAGTHNPRGYITIVIKRKSYLAHRLIFLMFNGWLPEFIDHADLNRKNNRIENLRAATRAQNNFNCGVRKHSLSGVKHVGWVPRLNKWLVRMRVNGKNTHLGVFEDIELAKFVASEYRDKYHGEFANHG